MGSTAVSERKSLIAPIPALEGYFTFTLMPQLFLNARARGLKATISGSSGSMLEATGTLDLFITSEIRHRRRLQLVTGHKPIDLTPDCDRASYSPAFSPDGSLIAYGSRCGDGGLFIMGASGENVRRVAPFGADPAWSPDGREIVFSTEAVANPYGRAGTSELWRVALGGAQPQKIYAEDAIQPSVSPHGLRIAFWALPTGGSQRDIWTIPYKGLAAGEKPVPVTQDPAVDWNPVWSSDGKELYFLSNRDGAMNLWKVPIDEATGKVLGPARPERLPAREVGGFTLSRDGRAVVYVDRETTYAIDRLTFDAEARLVGKPEEIYESSLEMSDFDISFDGKLFAFDSRGGAQDDIYVLGSDGTGLRQLTDDVFRDRHPAFSPDGKRLAFHSDRSGRYDIWTIATDGSGLAQMTKSTGDTIIEPLWSPDGKHVATNSGKASFVATLDEKGAAAKMQKHPGAGARVVLHAARLVPRRPAPARGILPAAGPPDVRPRLLFPGDEHPFRAHPRRHDRRQRPPGQLPRQSRDSPRHRRHPRRRPRRRHRSRSSCPSPMSGATTTSCAAARRPATPSASATTPTSGSAPTPRRPTDRDRRKGSTRMALERALKTKDIVLFNVAAIVGMRWIALAAANGPSSLFLWVLAAIVFFIPQGFAVTALSSAIPEEGGLYVWTSKAFGQRQGFLAGWLYWASNITYFPTLTLSTVVFALYIFGTRFAALEQSATYAAGASLVLLGDRPRS